VLAALAIADELHSMQRDLGDHDELLREQAERCLTLVERALKQNRVMQLSVISVQLSAGNRKKQFCIFPFASFTREEVLGHQFLVVSRK